MAPAPAELDRLADLLNTGRYAELENRARSLLEQFPDSGFVWNLLGISLQMQGKDALPVLQKATELLPDDAAAHSNLGAILKGRGRLAEAEASYRRALELAPAFAEAHSNLGITLREQGRLAEAEASYRRALEIRPDSAIDGLPGDKDSKPFLPRENPIQVVTLLYSSPQHEGAYSGVEKAQNDHAPAEERLRSRVPRPYRDEG